MSALVQLRGVVKDYPGVHQAVHALRSVDLTVEPGSLTAIHGRSGSGKTTLLNVIGGLDRADRGEIDVCGLDLMSASDAALTELRRNEVAFVFQAFGLLPMLSAAENVEVPLRLQGMAGAERRVSVADLLELVGLGPRGEASADRVVGWRTAARRHRQGTGGVSVVADRRRTDRPARLPNRRRHHRADTRIGERAGGCCRAGNARRIDHRIGRPTSRTVGRRGGGHHR